MTVQETESIVKHCYSTWSTSYYDDYYGDKAAYPPIHRDLMKSLLEKEAPGNLLDAGCGPASFLRDMLDTNIDLFGFDLTPEMVTEGKRIFEAANLPSERVWEGSVLEPAAFVAPTGEASGGFDSAVCVGVLPHIPAECDVQVIENLRSAVKPGGLVILEARNQLFSLFTANRYSYEFMTDELIQAEPLNADANGASSDLMAALEELKQQYRMDLPPIRRGKEDEPGYDEVLSRTHNPLQLKQQFSEAGFTDVETLFYHFHCLPPMFEAKFPEYFRRQSLAMENPNDWRGHFMASAFLVVGRRK